ncbi:MULTISPECIES: PLP-dependent aminotransferase family protein [unclassified Meiothermus]|uniref:aminotransferase-like domain-containing protein n=1 Tax=unclassified Meiothermus TaxID=370471 RepID=UPI000D7C0E25|nr:MULTISPECIES: PLP-dependent aminotransferase family protein [unclassified Meiothermus]PZA07652.1 PLP-dependent aminotransferase family protein [Meiothermus sp. Pnk-1]RYM36489.1 PLP-dependent aminotransferase family protein [Meiothermus sp. PNK-Is4]
MSPEAPPQPAHQTLAQQLRENLRGLEPGTRLPAVRELVARYGVSPVTVHKALRQLAQQGLVVVRPGSGTYVAERRIAQEDYGWQEVALGQPPDPTTGIRELMGPAKAGMLPLGEAYPDRSLTALKEIQAAVRRVARRLEVWDWAPAEGLESLRSVVAGELGAGFTSRDVQITPGAQAALSTAFRALAAPGSPILMESPTYPGAIGVARSLGLNPIPVPVDAQGVRPELLQEAFAKSGARVFYCQPLHANPSGAVLSPERRKTVLRVAEAAGAFVVENDYARELSFEAEAPPPLAALEPSRVVYIRSFSKTTAPGLRVAAVVAKGPAGSRIRSLRVLDDHFVSLLLQEVAVDVLTAPSRRTHLQRLRAELRRRRDAALELLRELLPQLRPWTIPTGSVFLWLRLPEGWDDVEASRRAMLAGVQVFPGRIFFPGEPSGPFLRLSYAAVGVEGLREGITRLAEALEARG